MRIDELDTPVPVVDLDIVEHNLAKMQAYCDSHGLALRPHIKTHKIPAFAHRQVELGAKGITCQKLGEAEVMIDAGLDDVLISYPLVGPAKADRLAALSRRAKLRVAVDSTLAVETVAAAARASNVPIGVLVEFDSGNARTGVISVDEAFDLAVRIEKSGLRFDGLMTYPSTDATAAFVANARDRFSQAGITIGVVSGGGTPNAWQAHQIAGLTEVRVGTYIYHDRATVAAGAADFDECAFHVHATVISRPTPDRAVIDAGSKSLSSDRVDPSAGSGYGLIKGYEDAVIERLNEEHGVIDISRCSRKPQVGERVQILPNHVCVVSNLHDEIAVSRGGILLDTRRVEARGKTR
ncbi:MAG TPA: alanine racemase [Rhizomicrobium sp.]|nr:alanine racemase [Rhizomicrobium sp.]